MTEPRKESVEKGYEVSDLNATRVWRVGVIMFVAIILSLWGLWGFAQYMNYQTPPERAASVAAREYPAPQLQEQPKIDLDDLQAREERVLENYRWVNKEQGRVAIPIDRAMDLMAERAHAEEKKEPAATAQEPAPTEASAREPQEVESEEATEAPAPPAEEKAAEPAQDSQSSEEPAAPQQDQGQQP